jgi:two-component system, response regulator YesN
LVCQGGNYMKLLIADDDEQIRSGIEEGINWSSLDINEVITASNGIEALQRFTEHLPEIVITDVKMPGIDGLELLKRIKEIKPQTRVVILSGYNDFEYLKRAIQLDAVDYEMKPVRARRLIALIQKIKEDILREQVSEQAFNKYLQSYKINFVEELLTGSISDRLIILQELDKYFEFDAKGTLLCLCVQIDIDQRRELPTVNFAMETVRQLFDSTDLSCPRICLKAKDGKFIFLLKLETSSYLYYQQFINDLKNRLRRWRMEVQSLCQTSFTAGISTLGSASDIVKIYSEADKALSLRLYEESTESTPILVYDSSIELIDRPITALLENELFKSQLVHGEFAHVVEAIHSDFERLKKERKHSRKSVISYCRNLLQMFLITVINVPDKLNAYIQSKLEMIENEAEFKTIEDYEAILITVFEEVNARLTKDAVVKLSPVMARADEFIRKNYTRELTIEMLAEYVDKTPNYFSHLFKKELGISFKEYVNRLRVSKAKELILGTNDLIYEISEKVGFSDYTYFTQVFKKMEGYPPTVLRKKTASPSDISEKN